MKAIAPTAFFASILGSIEAFAQQGTGQPAGVRPSNHMPLLYFGLALTFAMIALWIAATRYRARIS